MIRIKPSCYLQDWIRVSWHGQVCLLEEQSDCRLRETALSETRPVNHNPAAVI